ncbi:thermonuclease family protein [Thauera linaloolentis]|uniref:TNase-like domain-containing protein n=1 Tax=Thauera linaloolentis (strain DSM 12138 / JCM 21573 / CCUG 41526 / CIP 105981 / IAM 15112 / NBRC 102519 / 47Lol) TaxID=1123367 RepID=N6Z800_THAL4|nr:thermonuclease family protein [Thauera linaloolentis]ENO90433.1 hypothetical protein C666_00975 [Thauera linaloolentis 47Lol = DSM 12138]MCM8566294.1 thermonuclease family protein [Thauera linaloolentis]
MTASTILLCLVIAIADGDTLTCLENGHQQVKVRLGEIDAPESGQAYGDRSKQSLAAICHRKQAIVRITDTDQYGRTVGRVTCDGVDANAEQVRTGMAWVYDQHVIDRGMYRLQDEARAARRGLWAGPAATPPWSWRQQQRSVSAPPAPSRTTPPRQALAAAASVEVRGNKRSGIYHVPGCRNYHDISPRNVEAFRTEAEARAAGYRKAGNCR